MSTGHVLAQDRESVFWVAVRMIPRLPDEAAHDGQLSVGVVQYIKLFYRLKGIPGLGLQFIGCIYWNRSDPRSYCRYSYNDPVSVDSPPWIKQSHWFIFGGRFDVPISPYLAQGHFEIVGTGGMTIPGLVFRFPDIKFEWCYQKSGCTVMTTVSTGGVSRLMPVTCSVQAPSTVSFRPLNLSGRRQQTASWQMTVSCTGDDQIPSSRTLSVNFDGNNVDAQDPYILKTDKPGVIVRASQTASDDCQSNSTANRYRFDRTKYPLATVPSNKPVNAQFYWHACIQNGQRPAPGPWTSSIFYNVFYQ